VLHGLSVIDGSLERSVRWRRFWWRTAGVALLAVAGVLLALTPAAYRDHQARALLGLLLLAVAAFLFGGRLLQGSRKAPRSLHLRRIASGFALAGAVCYGGLPTLAMLLLLAWDLHRGSAHPPRDGSRSPGRLGPRASP
jgi:drug/metabolite transporter (DMT)-like permease